MPDVTVETGVTTVITVEMGPPGPPGMGSTPEEIAEAVEDYLTANPPDGAVDSVNGQSGVVVLNAASVGAAPTAHTHIIGNITGLQAALDGKQAAGSYAAASHTHTSAQIVDFTEAVQDAVAALLAQGTNVTLTYDDAGNSLTIAAAGGGGGLDAEAVRDAIGVALIGSGVISVTVNDAADTITISSTATVNSTDAALRDRSTHTGTQSADTVVDGTTNKAFTAAEKTKLSGVATGATANQSDATTNAAIALKANAANPVFTGTTQAPTPTNGDNSTKIATTAFIQTTLSGMAGTYAPLASPNFTGTVTGVTKAHVGLSNVDNTSDAAKPVSTATATALSGKVAGTGITAIVSITQAAYDALTPPVATTLYVIVG